jgi:signal recognition particle receptor subunit alpha
LLDNIATIFVGVYKDQLQSNRSRIAEYPFDRYFDQQIQELESTAAPVIDEHAGAHYDEKKNALVSSDNGGPPPPPVPSLLKGMWYCCWPL